MRVTKEAHYSYLRAVVNQDRQEYVRRCMEMLHDIRKDFDTIAISGMSGALVGPAVATRMRKGLLIVRKDVSREPAHSHLQVEGVYAPRYVIIDDFASTGGTISRIQELVESAMRGELPVAPQLVRVVLYSDSDDYSHRLPDRFYGKHEQLWSWEKWVRTHRGVQANREYD